MAQTKLTDRQAVQSIDLTAEVAGILPTANGGTGNSSGNAATATALQTARTINGVSFDGTGNITIPDAGVLTPTAVKTANYTALAGDYVPANSDGGAFTVTLPSAPADKAQVGVTNSGLSTPNAITVACGGTDELVWDGQAVTSISLASSTDLVVLQYKASIGVWYILSLKQDPTPPRGTFEIALPGATPAMDFSVYRTYLFTGMNAAITSMSSGISGNPSNGDPWLVRFKDNGTARAITWGASYRAIGVTLPTTTVVSKTLYVGGFYNSTDSKYDVTAVGQEA